MNSFSEFHENVYAIATTYIVLVTFQYVQYIRIERDQYVVTKLKAMMYIFLHMY